MICPGCKRRDTRVSRTIDGAAKVSRERACPCGTIWTTTELIDAGSLLLAATNNISGAIPPLAASKQPSNAPNSVGGVGGGLSPIRPESDPIRSLSVSDPSLDHSQGVDRARAKQAYSPDFERFWSLYPKKKSKGAAWKAWRKLRPPIDAVLNALSWQRISAEWRKDGGEFIPHPASYLNATGWEDEPPGPNGAIARPQGPPVAVAELAAARARQLEEAAERARIAEAEKFKQERQRDAGGTT